MKFLTKTGKLLPKVITDQIKTVGKSSVDRREFLALASTFGASAATAYAMLGIPKPANAASDAKKGGTVRYQMEVRAMKDPRTYDWTQMANYTRGWLEYLISYENDGTFKPVLLDSWEISDDAKVYTLNLRKGVKWNNGDDFTAEHVAKNIEMWCEKDVEGNSMAGRMATMINPDTNKVLDGVIEIVDAHTIKLKLPKADISLIAGMSDYPAAIVHPDHHNPEDMLGNPVGTGPYLPESLEVGVKGVLVRNADHTWWNEGNGAWMDRIEFIDYGTDPSSWIAAVEADEVDAINIIDGEFIDLMDAQDGWSRNEVVTMGTIVIRPNQLAEVGGKKPYADKRVRQALAMAVNNKIPLELGISGRGTVAQNHHVGPAHPAYADIGDPKYDPAGALQLLKDAGMEDFEHELTSIDSDWRKDTTDAIAAQLREAGIKVKRTVIPGSSFWNDWTKYPFSSTNWNHRPLGVQIWALAYRSGEAWNEFGWSNAEFDSVLEQALAVADVEKRRELMAKGQKIIQDEGVTIQPYWKSLYNHTRANLAGAGVHIQQEIRPADIHWT